ncbi:eL32 family ribosomal protein [Candidatus Micrarchaeota archaeon]|nr:eL32 family ribosomal protein [Candidatus Micrarchaeota archaeon]
MAQLKAKPKRIVKKKKPKFNVPNLGFFKSVKARWRKPRGTHNKKRMKFKFMGALPKVGYRNAAKTRGMHPGGMREVLVNNMAELESLGEGKVVVRLASTLGGRKRKALEEKAKTLKLVILNMKNDGKAEAAPSKK